MTTGITFYRRNKMADLNTAVDNAVADVKTEAVQVNTDFNAQIDPLLVRWAKSSWSGVIAVGFGVALLVIGAVLGKFLF